MHVCSDDQNTVKYVSQLASMDSSWSHGMACAACLGAWSENRWVRAPDLWETVGELCRVMGANLTQSCPCCLEKESALFNYRQN